MTLAANGPLLPPLWLEEQHPEMRVDSILGGCSTHFLSLIPEGYAVKVYLIATDSLVWLSFDTTRRPALRAWEARRDKAIGEEETGLGTVRPISLVEKTATPISIQFQS